MNDIQILEVLCLYGIPLSHICACTKQKIVHNQSNSHRKFVQITTAKKI